MQTIDFPSPHFDPIDDSHPPFPQTPTFPQSPSFPQQVSELRGNAALDSFPLSLHASEGPPPPPPPPGNDNDNDNHYFDNHHHANIHQHLVEDSHTNDLTSNKVKPSSQHLHPPIHSPPPPTLSLPHPALSLPLATLSHPPPTLSLPPSTLSHQPPVLSHPPPTLSLPPPTLSLPPPTLSPPPPPLPLQQVVLTPHTLPAHRLPTPIYPPLRLQRVRSKRPNNGLLSGLVNPLLDFIQQPTPPRRLRAPPQVLL